MIPSSPAGPRDSTILDSALDSAILSNCDREVIHAPERIQPFGALVAIEGPSLRIVRVSANAEAVFGVAPAALLGRTAAQAFGAEIALRIIAGASQVRTRTWTAHIVVRNGVTLVEAESVVADAEDEFAPKSERSERGALDRLQGADSLADLLNIAAETVYELTGLDRVMVYKFHEDLHGEVVAESVRPGVDSYLGLHYPASDIPVPARAVFLQNWVRIIPDVDAEPVGLLPERAAPLDLGASILRAVSPVHLEYLRNMQVGASLTISLHVSGRLWGLIACHSLTPRMISSDLRDACESIGRMTSALIAVQDERDDLRARAHFREIQSKLSERLHGGNDMAAELSHYSPNLVDLINASGTAAALYLDGYWVTVGQAPSIPELNRLVDWLRTTHAGRSTFATDALAREFPEAEAYRERACGLLALAIPKTERTYILWFRPELIRSVRWAGKPEKIEAPDGSLHPRASFNAWVENVAGRSKAWTSLEIDAALELRNAVAAVDLQRQFIKEQAARAEAERAMRAREELMQVLSHDLRNPISSIKLNAKIAHKVSSPETLPQVREFLNKIDRATTNMDNLISDILSVTKIEAGHLDLNREPLELAAIIDEVVEFLDPIARDKGLTLRFDAGASLEGCRGLYDRSRLIQVFSNIIGNAIKFAESGTTVRVAIDKCGPESAVVSIADSGPGITPENLPNIFDRFWQAAQTKRFGTGLGLAIAKGIVVQHGGEIWAESDGSTGSTFYISLPVSRA